MLGHLGFSDDNNHINNALLYKLVNESNNGYVFENDDERREVLDFVEDLTEIGSFVDKYCYENQTREGQLTLPWYRPLHPNIYCPRGKMPEVSVFTYCNYCSVLCKCDKGRCKILKTGESQTWQIWWEWFQGQTV